MSKSFGMPIAGIKYSQDITASGLAPHFSAAIPQVPLSAILCR